MSRKMLLAVLAAAVLACLWIASTAQAQLDPCGSTSTSCQVGTDASTKGGVKTASEMTAAELDAVATGATCSWRQRTQRGYNITNSTLWKINERVDWCGNGNRITQISNQRWVSSCCFVGWDFSGWTDAWASGGVGSDSAVRGTQAKFKLCLPKVLCVQTATPWVQLRVYQDGRSYGTQGGD